MKKLRLIVGPAVTIQCTAGCTGIDVGVSLQAPVRHGTFGEDQTASAGMMTRQLQ